MESESVILYKGNKFFKNESWSRKVLLEKPAEFSVLNEKRASTYAPSQETQVGKGFCTTFPPKKTKIKPTKKKVAEFLDLFKTVL